MILSDLWLREWIDHEMDSAALAQCLTMAGLEVESVSRAGPDLPKILVGRIEAIHAHPESQRLQVCRVSVGEDTPLQIVCGAANARLGLKVAVALPEAELPGGTTIHTSTIRGVESQGMLCSFQELGQEEHSEGILELDPEFTVGQRVDTELGFDDTVLDIALTPNRGDCLSVLGVARELSILTGRPLKQHDVPGVEADHSTAPEIDLHAPDACPRYAGRYLRNIDPQARTPLWMAERLRRSGVRPISPVVDVTNYVMLELGQPMHAFDASKIDSGIIVRNADQGEALTLLDDTELVLDRDSLVIADHRGAVALAGIMGGLESAIGNATTDILLESAHFDPVVVARTARGLNMQTDASFRFERGVDPAMPPVASHYAAWLLKQITGGEASTVGDAMETAYMPKRRKVRVRSARIERLLGVDLNKRRTADILKRLGQKVKKRSWGWKVTAPSHRFDLEQEYDFIEEVARVIGYDEIPARLPRLIATGSGDPETKLPASRIRQALVDRDYHEVVNYSFVDREHQQRLHPELPSLALSNPIAEGLSDMRVSTWTGLLHSAVSNLNRQATRVRLFEIGKTFNPGDDGLKETEVVGGVVCGPAHAAHWGGKPSPADFFDVKADVEAVLSLSGLKRYRFRKAALPSMHPGVCAEIVSEGRVIGQLGRLHPRIQTELDVSTDIYLFELEMEALRSRSIPEYERISRFPAIRRDLSLEVEEQHQATDLLDTIRETAGSTLADLELFDLYHHKNDSSTTKSMGFGLTLRDSSRTLTDQEVEAIIKNILDVLNRRFGAKLRT